MLPKNLIAPSISTFRLLESQASSEDMISITRGSASNAACALRKERRHRRAMTSVAVCAYSCFMAYRTSASMSMREMVIIVFVKGKRTMTRVGRRERRTENYKDMKEEGRGMN